MKRILLFAILLILFVIPCLGQDEIGKVKGVVFSTENSIVQTAIISFQNKKHREDVTANPGGEYEIALPAGYYVVTAHRFGFKQYLFKKFRVMPNKTKTLNIRLRFTSYSSH